MKRLLKSWVFWGFAVPAFAAGLLFFAWLDGRYSLCRCGTIRSEWALGFRERQLKETSLLGWSTFRDTAFADDVLPASHTHRWGEHSGDTRNFFRKGRRWANDVIYCPSGLALRYRDEAPFRDWLLERLKKGELRREDVERVAMDPRADDDFAFGWPGPLKTSIK